MERCNFSITIASKMFFIILFFNRQHADKILLIIAFVIICHHNINIKYKDIKTRVGHVHRGLWK